MKLFLIGLNHFLTLLQHLGLHWQYRRGRPVQERWWWCKGKKKTQKNMAEIFTEKKEELGEEGWWYREVEKEKNQKSPERWPHYAPSPILPQFPDCLKITTSLSVQNCHITLVQNLAKIMSLFQNLLQKDPHIVVSTK